MTPSNTGAGGPVLGGIRKDGSKASMFAGVLAMARPLGTLYASLTLNSKGARGVALLCLAG